MKTIDPKLLEQASKVTKKRAKTVIDHIIKHGSVTTEELKDIYGYNHPPRAARDVREEGIPLETIKVHGSDGRTIGAYIFGDPSKIENNKLGGRVIFSKKFKDHLIHKYGSKCAISLEEYEPRYLQIDHRIPYEISGDNSSSEENLDAFMLLSAAAQRQKSWSCEGCNNIMIKNVESCQNCYWAYPDEYTHIALQPERRVDLIFKDEEISLYNDLIQQSKEQQSTPQDLIKTLIRRS